MKAKPFIYLALLVAAGCAPVAFHTDALPGPSGPPAPPYAGWQVAFERNGDIWIANGDGSGQKLLIKNGTAPEWSPDGKKMAFVREGSVMTADANGKNQKAIYKPSKKLDDVEDMSISWNKRANEIVFSKPVGAGVGIFYSRNSQPAKPIGDLQPDVANAGYAFSDNSYPEWSPTGKFMAFVRNGDVWLCQRRFDQITDGWGTSFIWDVTRLAATARYDAPVYRVSREIVGANRLSWSKDEKTLAYSVCRMGGSGTNEIHLLRLGRGNEYAVDKSVKKDELVGDGLYPAFCPDGQTLSYVKQTDDGRWDLLARATDGKVRRVLTDVWQPSWKPVR